MFINDISRNDIFEIFTSLGRSQTRAIFITKTILSHQVLYIVRKILILATINRKQN